MRVLIVSDTHGVIDPRLAELAGTCDCVAHAGDVGSASVLETLGVLDRELFAVRGNNDVAAKWDRAARTMLDALPFVHEITLPGGILAVVHGDTFAPKTRHQALRQRFPTARAIAYGHSHRLVVDDAEIPWVLNPGAAGRARTYGGPSGLILTASARRWHVDTVRFPTSS